MPHYYYSPVYAETVTNNDGSTTYQTSIGAYDTDGSTIILAAITGGYSCSYDSTVPRFVTSCSEAQTFDGWTDKTDAEIEVDYPSLLPLGVY